MGELGLALLLSALIGVERQIQKSAGLRTHTLVGVGAAPLVLVSKYGFTDVLVPGQIVLDPSRVAAQIVTGIGFIGGGLIFVRRDAVRGPATAATAVAASSLTEPRPWICRVTSTMVLRPSPSSGAGTAHRVHRQGRVVGPLHCPGAGPPRTLGPCVAIGGLASWPWVG